jgi:hypothetical protein
MKNTYLTIILFLSSIILFSGLVSATTYNYYTQTNAPPMNLNASSIDYATIGYDADYGNYYGFEKYNSSIQGGVIKLYNISTVLGVSTLLERKSYFVNNIGGLNLYKQDVQDISVDTKTGTLYVLTGQSDSVGVLFLRELNGSNISQVIREITLSYNNAFMTAFNYSLSINTNYNPSIIITKTNSTIHTAYFLNGTTDQNGNINSSLALVQSLDLNGLVYAGINPTYLKFHKDSAYAGSYYELMNEEGDRITDIHSVYLLAKNDLTLSGLRVPTIDDVSNTNDRQIFITPDGGVTLQMFRKISGFRYLVNVAHTNFTPLSNGTSSCFSGYGCFNTTAYCLDTPHYFCNNTVFNIQISHTTGLPFVGGQCQEAYASYCDLSCTNQLIDGVMTGVCGQSGNCTNTCNIQGHPQCTNTNTYATCDFYGGSTCLSLGNFIGCQTGYGCIDGTCLYGLSNVTLASRYLFYVSPQTYNTNVTNAGTSNYYVVNHVDNIYNKIAYYTDLPQATQGFFVSTTAPASYTARNCEYTQTQIYDNTTILMTNDTITEAFNGFNAGYINITVTPVTDGLANNVTAILFIGKDASNKILFRNYLVRDYNTNICLYQATSVNNMSSTYFCDSTVTGDIRKINMVIAEYSENGGRIRISTETNIVMLDGTIKTFDTGWVNAEDTSALSTFRVTMTGTNTTNNATIQYNGMNVWNGQDNTLNWEATTPNIYQQTCYYLTSGCRTVRTYLSDGTLSFFNYKDWNLCISNDKGQAIQNGNVTDNMNPMTKILVALGVSVGIFIVIFILGFIASERTENHNLLTIFSFFGMFCTIGFLIYFAIKEWLPAWILIVMFLMCASVITLLIRSMVTGNS